MLTLSNLRSVLSYNQETGIFRRKINGGGHAVGTEAGYVDMNGYRCLAVAGRPYKAHRLAWFYVTGYMPAVVEYVDHINGVRGDNRFVNLRLASNSQNQANRGAPKNSSTGIKGVRWQPSRDRWIAMITKDGRAKNLGRFMTQKEAEDAYNVAANSLFGDFAHGSAKPKAGVDGVAQEGAIHHPDLTQQALHELLHYDPDTGWFTRKVSRQGQAKVGDRAGNIDPLGYRRLKIQGRSYREHHLAWMYVYGMLPVGEVDHINGDPGDNRIVNLRECERHDNMANRRVQGRSRVGLKGVSFDDRCVRKYSARIQINGERIDLGAFETAQAASNAYNKAAIEAFGQFAIANRST